MEEFIWKCTNPRCRALGEEVISTPGNTIPGDTTLNCDTCDQPMHRGPRVSYCDGCGRYRRDVQPVVDSSGDANCSYCFLCRKENERGRVWNKGKYVSIAQLEWMAMEDEILASDG